MLYLGMFWISFNVFVKFSRQQLKPGFLRLGSIIIVSDARTSVLLVKVNSAYMKHKV